MRSQGVLFGTGLLALVSAHSTFVQLTAGGITNPVAYGIRDPSYDGPINDVTTDALACNGGPNPTTPSANVINVKAGETVQATWRHTLTSTAANDAVYVIDPSHKGPVMAYMKKVTDATSDTGIGAGWFKISEAGLNVATGTWAITDLIANAGIQSINIPDCIENGQYLLRAELIALHSASSPLGAQLYMECAQINVTGGSGSSTPATVSFPGAYGQSDPGILINIYQTLTNYTIPGPRPFTCGGSAAPSSISTNPVTSLAPSSTTLTTSVKTTATSSTAATSSVAAGGVALYGQCGGTGWTGATACVSGATCKANGAYYSQCVPS